MISRYQAIEIAKQYGREEDVKKSMDKLMQDYSRPWRYYKISPEEALAEWDIPIPDVLPKNPPFWKRVLLVLSGE